MTIFMYTLFFALLLNISQSLVGAQLTNGTFIEVQERCGGCYDTDCQPANLVYSTCTAYCPSCGVFCDGYYLLKELPNYSGETSYIFEIYEDVDCSIAKDFSFIVQCDSCYSEGLCAHYYLSCGIGGGSGEWFYYTLGVTLFFGLIAVVILALAAYIYNVNKKRKYQSIDSSESYNVRYLNTDNNSENNNNENNINNNNNDNLNESSSLQS